MQGTVSHVEYNTHERYIPDGAQGVDSPCDAYARVEVIHTGRARGVVLQSEYHHGALHGVVSLPHLA